MSRSRTRLVFVAIVAVLSACGAFLPDETASVILEITTLLKEGVDDSR